MFDDLDTSKELSARLRQDMNPGSQGVVTPSAPSAPSAPPPPPPAPPPITPPPLENKQFQAEIETEPVVEAAPFINDTAKSKSYLAWIALLLILPSVFFWFCSLLYVAGSQAILVKLVTAVPFIVIVSANVLLPILAILLAFIMLRRTEPGEAGRGIAKLTMIFAGLALVVLLIWLLAEIF